MPHKTKDKMKSRLINWDSTLFTSSKTGFLQYNDKSVLQAKYVMFEIGELRNRIEYLQNFIRKENVLRKVRLFIYGQIKDCRK